MPIFIGRNHDGKTVSIISAKNKALANAYWQGAKSQVADSFEFDPIPIEQSGMIGVLLTTEIMQLIYPDISNRTREFVVVT